MSGISRKEEMQELNDQYARLPNSQDNWNLSRRLVPGDGPLDAKIMIIGQAPGRFEDQEGKPFIGAAGKFLNLMITIAGLKREDLYITSVVQFFPPENRLPTDEEAELCMPLLERQIEIIKPKLIVVLGNFSSINITGIGEVTKNHGRVIEDSKRNCKIFITLHPAAAVRIKANVPTIEADFRNLKELVKTLN